MRFPSTTRRSFLGSAALLALAGGGDAASNLPGRREEEARFAARLQVRGLRSTAPPPPFGSLLPDTTAPASVAGIAHDRTTGRRLGRFTQTLAPEALQVHTLELEGGAIIALGIASGGALPVSGGTGRFERASGTLRIKPAGGANALDLDVELSL